MKSNETRFIDLFAGIGGMRLGFENACKSLSINPRCVFSSEIKKHALETYRKTFGNHIIHGDIREIDAKDIPDFDFLLAGFPCQAFSSAGKRRGFLDTRGTLFFEIERILREKRPYGFILENVEGLKIHDRINRKKNIGRTLETILGVLNGMGYKTSYGILNSKDFGVAQERKRIFIVGTLDVHLSLDGFEKNDVKLSSVLEEGRETIRTHFTKKILEHYRITDLYGKAIKDTRGKEDNIHSWDIGLKGEVSKEQRHLLTELLKQRRRKYWATKKGIKWMDGMPLTMSEISTFFKTENLKELLDDLVKKGYLKHEHPKDMVRATNENGDEMMVRDYKEDAEKGYNIVAGKLSFEFSKILDPNGVTPALVATDISRLAVPDGNGLRKLTVKEALKLFGFPQEFELDVSQPKAYDLLGNTVVVPVVESVSKRAIGSFLRYCQKS